MAEHVVNGSYEVSAWKGTPDDIANLLERAENLLREAVPETDDGSPSLTIITGSDEVKFDDLDEFRRYDVGKLAKAETISGHVGSAMPGHTWVSLRFRRSSALFPGASVSVSGTKHVAVSGLTAELGKMLDEGKRRRPRLGWRYILVVAAVSLTVAFAVGAAQRYVSDAAGWVLASLSMLFSLVLASSFYTLPILVPSVEILDPANPHTRYERWRIKLLAAAGALILVVIGAVLQAMLD